MGAPVRIKTQSVRLGSERTNGYAVFLRAIAPTIAEFPVECRTDVARAAWMGLSSDERSHFDEIGACGG
jgi:hypothetical protein